MTIQASAVTKVILGKHQISTRVLPAGYPLHRLFRYFGGEFKPAPPEWRNGRLDPPKPRRHEYGVLYTSGSVKIAAIECRAILLVPTDPPTYAVSEFAVVGQPPHQLATLTSKKPVQFVDLSDPSTASTFGLDISSTLDHLGPWREASAKIFDALVADLAKVDVVGFCYHSRHEKGETNYALLEGRYENAFECRILSEFNPRLIDDVAKPLTGDF